jgi:hypothetical protein
MRGQGQFKHEEKKGLKSQGRGESETGQKDWDTPHEAGYIRSTVCYRCRRRENRRRVEHTRGDMDRSIGNVGRLSTETIRLLGELALAEMGVAEGGIRVVLWLLIDSMGQEVPICNIWRHVYEGSVIERVQGGGDDAMGTEAKLVLGYVAVE